ncbi:MAG: hypothetical protein JW812_02410 [Alphaproteobacteria bacterium]|nr:hypothetical protein [Alphaproteobacteria bacterium]MBN2780274.1 hypothetical protein [Alphaproteobacteria bacterium]
MKKTLIIGLCVFAVTSASAFIIKDKRIEDFGKKQTVIAVCETFNDKASDEVCIAEREKRTNGTWDLWGIKGKKKGTFKRHQDAIDSCCFAKDMK